MTDEINLAKEVEEQIEVELTDEEIDKLINIEIDNADNINIESIVKKFPDRCCVCKNYIKKNDPRELTKLPVNIDNQSIDYQYFHLCEKCLYNIIVMVDIYIKH